MYNLSKFAAGSVLAATAAISGASAVLADGYAPKGKVVYERPSDWSGVYFGVSSGYQWSSIDVANPVSGFGISSDHHDALAGAHLGIQHQFGSIVLGVEGGWQASLRDKDGSSEACWNPAPVLVVGGALTGSCTGRLNDVLTVGARLGYAAGHWMPYVTGGYANGGFDFNARIPNAGVPPTPTATTLTETAHKRLGGYYIGGGVEWNVSPGWTAGLEYRHYEFDDGNTTAYNPATGLAREPVRFDASTDTVTARVSWRWGREIAVPLK